MTYILKKEIPKYILPYIDNVLIRGLETRYKLPDGKVKVLEQNPRIRRFIFEHLETVNRILQQMKYAGGTFSGPKMVIYSDHITIVRFDCLCKDKRPTSNAIEKILR